VPPLVGGSEGHVEFGLFQDLSGPGKFKFQTPRSGTHPS